MTDSRGPNPAPRVGRALPAKWQLAAAAVAAFLLYSIWAPVAEWAGLRSRPEPGPAQLRSQAAVDGLPAIEAKLVAALRELAAGADDAKREGAEKLLRDYVRVRGAAEAEIQKKSAEESEIAKQERKRKEDEAYSRAWSRFGEMLDDRRVSNGEIVDHLAKNITVMPAHALETAVLRFIERTKAQSGEERQMTLLAREIETLVKELPRHAGPGGDAYQAQVRIRERIAAYHRARAKVGVPEDRTGERELRAIELMPFESGARVLLRNLSKAHPGALTGAVLRLQVDWQTGAAAADGPLFPELPRFPKRKFGGSEQQQADQALGHKKGDLEIAIETIYRDCAEPYRQRYVGHLKHLVAQYMAMGHAVANMPVTKYYPEFLLSDAASPNERLVGALEILRQGVFTPAVQSKIPGLPEALIGKACPAERLAYGGPRGGQFPLVETLGIWDKDEFSALSADRVPSEAVRWLNLALKHCEPRTRDVYAEHIILFVRRAMAVKRRRGAPTPADEAIAAQLRSPDRSEMAAGLKRAILLADITEDLARAAQAASERLFQEQCPVSPYATQLEAYRAAEKAAAEREAARKAKK